jgi:integrase
MSDLVGWFMAGMAPDDYEAVLDTTERHSGTRCVRLSSKVNQPSNFGTLMQEFDAVDYRGKRVRLGGWVKTKDVVEWCGLPRVTPHGLRGTHAAASMKPRTNPNEVAAALGHANIGVTLRHYADPQAVADAKQEAAASALLSKSSSKTFGHAPQKHEGPTNGPGQPNDAAA